MTGNPPEWLAVWPPAAPTAVLLAAALAAAVIALALAYRLGLSIGAARGRQRARDGSRRALQGKVAEQWAPFVDGFPGRATEARFLGAPVDYVVFRGIDHGRVDEVVFVEVKSGDGALSAIERALRDCVTAGRVSFVEHRVPRPAASRSRRPST
jgi:hypothetical protein